MFVWLSAIKFQRALDSSENKRIVETMDLSWYRLNILQQFIEFFEILRGMLWVYVLLCPCCNPISSFWDSAINLSFEYFLYYDVIEKFICDFVKGFNFFLIFFLFGLLLQILSSSIMWICFRSNSLKRVNVRGL